MSFEMHLLGSIELNRDGARVDLGPAKRRAMFATLALDANRPVSLRLAAMDDQRVAALEDYVQARMALGPRADVVPELRHHLALHPLRERAWGQLMLALYRAGDPAAALTAYGDARAVLREDLGIEPGAELSVLQRAILDRSPILSGRPLVCVPIVSGPTGAEPTLAAGRATGVPHRLDGTPLAGFPHHLPPDPAPFLDRAGALAALDRALRAAVGEGPPVVVVSGSGGVGKSAVAVHAARLAADAFAGGQVWVDLHGTQSRLRHLSAGEALGRVLRAPRVPPGDRLPTTDARAAQDPSVLTGRRVLVVVDNAVDAAHVRPLIPPGAGSALLVTSRSRMATLDGSVQVEIEPMSDHSALALLAALAGPDRVAAQPQEAHQLVRRCAGLPPALRIVGARPASRPEWPLALLADPVTGGPALLDELSYEDLSLRACFDAGYQPLSMSDEMAARAFRLLGTLPSGESVPHSVARWLGIGVQTAERILERLVDARLLDYVRPGRYRVPALLHRYAADPAAAGGPVRAVPPRLPPLRTGPGQVRPAPRLGTRHRRNPVPTSGTPRV